MAPGIYTIKSVLYQGNIDLFDHRDNTIGFTVIDSGSREYLYEGQDLGSILVNFEWKIQKK